MPFLAPLALAATLVVGGALIGGKVGKILSSVALIGAGILTGNPALIMAGVATGVSAFMKKPKGPPAHAVERLNASMDPQAPRKIVLGRTAMATDIRYQSYTDSQEYLHWIVCLAAHEVEAIEEIWFDTKQAWTVGGGVTGDYTGYLTVDAKLAGTSGNTVSIDANWGASQRLTGCAYVHLKFKLTGTSSTATSPFSQSVPTRMTVRGKGAKLYDPRLDSTVDGGSGSQLADDQTTWTYDTASGRNPALQLLFYLLGWTIGGRLSVGRGIPSDRIDLESFITAANACDETVTLDAGGNEPRYRAGGVFSEGEDPGNVIGNLLASMNAVLRDAGGKIAITVLSNDLGSPAAAFTEADILGEERWSQTPTIEQTFNVVRGRYTNTTDAALYQLVDYPEISLSSDDGIERIDSFDLALVESASQAQRLAKQRLQRNQYQGVYSAQFNARAWQVSVGDVIELSHAGLGWTDKLFRVEGHGVSMSGIVAMVLREEHADIYAWDEEESAAVVPATPTDYDPVLAPVIDAISDLEDDLAEIVTDLETISDDNVITGREKTETLIPRAAELAARYDEITARADDAGVSTTGADDARTDWLAFLGNMSPAWNDASQDTTLHVTAFADMDFPTGWTDVGSTTPTPNGIYTTITDNDAVSFEAITRVSEVQAADATFTAAIVVKKDSTPAATRRGMLRLSNSGGTSRNYDVMFDTQTGTGSVADSPNAPADWGVIELNADEWLVYATGAMAGGGTQAQIQVYPAIAGSGTYDGTKTGSIDVRAPTLAVGDWYDGGRELFRMALKVYSEALDALAKSISERDGTTSLQIDGPKLVTIPADYTGDTSDFLPDNQQYTARVGTGTVTPTWTRTVLSGSLTGTINSDGQLNVTAFASDEAKVLIEAEYEDVEQQLEVLYKRENADAPGSGGGGSSADASTTSFGFINSTTFTTIATLTVEAGSAGPVLAASLTCRPALSPNPSGGDESWNIEMKWVREAGGSDVDVGSTANSDPDPRLYTLESTNFRDNGSISVPATDSGRSVGVSYTYYLQAKQTSGTHTFTFTGTASVDS